MKDAKEEKCDCLTKAFASYAWQNEHLTSLWESKKQQQKPI